MRSTHKQRIGIAAVVAALSSAALAATPGPVPPEADRLLAREIFRELIGLRTTHDVGSTEAARAIERRLLAAGFSAADVVVIAPPDHPTKGSVVVRYRGKVGASGNAGAAGRASAAGKPVLFLGHLDVVEASRADWATDPFTLVERDGFFYGRGASDMKNGIAALVETLIRLKREGYAPSRDLIVAMTADEEGGGDANGPEFLLAKHRELVDAGLVVNLDGGGGTYRDDQRVYYTLGTSEKTYVTYTLAATSPGGHGSQPGPDNSIYHIATALTKLEALKFPLTLNATTRASFRMMADLTPGPQSEDMRAVAREPFDAAAAAAGERLSQTVHFNAQLRTTCTPTLINGGEAENALPQHTRLTLQCRMMPGETGEHVQQVLANTINDETLKLTMDAPPIASPESPPTPDIMATVNSVVHSMWPGVPIVPNMGAGYSDARQTRNAGMPSYDLGGSWGGPDDRRAHGNDERIGTREFDESVEYTWRLMKAFGERR